MEIGGDKTKANSIEVMTCKDSELSALDRQLSGVTFAASRRATRDNASMLKATQRGWIKGRNECVKADDKRACVHNVYQLRIAEIEARYGLVDGSGPVRFICEENPANDVSVTFFRTDPPLMITFGHSKDERRDFKQLLISMLCVDRNFSLWGPPKTVALRIRP